MEQPNYRQGYMKLFFVNCNLPPGSCQETCALLWSLGELTLDGLALLPADGCAASAPALLRVAAWLLQPRFILLCTAASFMKPEL